MCQVQETELTVVVSSRLGAHTYSMDLNPTLEERSFSSSSSVVAKSPHFSHSQEATRFSYTTTISADHILIPAYHTVYSALFYNGVILGLPCSTAALSRSKPPGQHVPPSLRPTETQLENVHYEWIDRFPLPWFREKMIKLSDVLSTEEFMEDLFLRRTWEIKSGAESWDESAWVPTLEFRAKWGMLF